MRVTLDKNAEPFGFCEARCGGQLRVGGRADRVAAFLDLYPWAKPEPEQAQPPQKPAAQAPVTGTGTEPEQPKAPPTKKAAPRSAFADAVALLGGRA